MTNETVELCPICSNKNLIYTNIDAFCLQCLWRGPRVDYINKNIKGEYKMPKSSDTITRISDYLIVNECSVSMDNIRFRFNMIPDLNEKINNMIVCGMIKVITLANGKDQVLLMNVPNEKCEWADIEVSFSTDKPPENMRHYRIHCKLNKDQQEQLREDVEGFVEDWVEVPI